ncbi:hypothetical protein [Bacillus litorisediminis]|uniref:hypothetical protein n=1 Tax=Bacillus litorisediminis TaxID=2922713 RepID=UPI001FAEA67E|nr:hypothetical protein [Bacillus litorisediminis]
MNVVFAQNHRLDDQTGIRHVTFAETPEHLTNENTTYVVWSDNQLESYFNKGHQLYIPYSRIKKEHADLDRVFVYFDLESFLFFKKISEEIVSQSKGVLRFRRLVDRETNSSIITEDLYVLSTVFGVPEEVKVLKSKQQDHPSHVILTVLFDKETLAHLEYTFDAGERIEFEWSGVKTILEFNSEEMNPFLPTDHSSLPIVYTVDSIIEHAHKLSPDFLAEMDRFHVLVKGGVEG